MMETAAPLLDVQFVMLYDVIIHSRKKKSKKRSNLWQKYISIFYQINKNFRDNYSFSLLSESFHKKIRSGLPHFF
jgi:hypothetical protein